MWRPTSLLLIVLLGALAVEIADVEEEGRGDGHAPNTLHRNGEDIADHDKNGGKRKITCPSYWRPLSFV